MHKLSLTKMTRFIRRHPIKVDTEYNLYCDKSGYLVYDSEPTMAVGAISCPKALVPLITSDILYIKQRHQVYYPLRWSHFNSTKFNLYLDLLDYFLSNDFLKFYGIIIPDKKKLYLNDQDFSDNLRYYTIYSRLCMPLINPEAYYNLYLSTTDIRSKSGIIRLRSELSRGFSQDCFKNIQTVRLFESELLQLANLIVGALTYKYRKQDGSIPKKDLSTKIFEKQSANKLSIVTVEDF